MRTGLGFARSATRLKETRSVLAPSVFSMRRNSSSASLRRAAVPVGAFRIVKLRAAIRPQPRRRIGKIRFQLRLRSAGWAIFARSASDAGARGQEFQSVFKPAHRELPSCP
jgi:hypothetical protein